MMPDFATFLPLTSLVNFQLSLGIEFAPAAFIYSSIQSKPSSLKLQQTLKNGFVFSITTQTDVTEMSPLFTFFLLYLVLITCISADRYDAHYFFLQNHLLCPLEWYQILILSTILKKKSLSGKLFDLYRYFLFSKTLLSFFHPLI